jgi:GGDEF domain-containing protein
MRNITQKLAKFRTYSLEIPVVFGIFEFLNYNLESYQLSLHSLSPHPYFFVILLFALTYSLYQSVFTSVIAVFLVTKWSLLPILDPIEQVTVLSNSIAFLVTGGVVGWYSSYQKTIVQSLQFTAEDLSGKIDDLEEDRDRLTKANLVLEGKVVSRQETLLTLYSVAQKLTILDKQEILESIPDLLITYLKAQVCSVYLQTDSGFVVTVKYGWETVSHQERLIEEYPLDHPLIKKIKKETHVLSVHELHQIDHAVLVSPLVNLDGSIFGMIKIEKMTFLDLTPSTIKLFETLSSWIVQSFKNAESYDRSIRTQLKDDLTGAYTIYYFKERLLREIRLAKRYKLDLSLSLVKIDNYDLMTEGTQVSVLKIVSHIMTFKFREDDIVVRMNEDSEYQFVVLQPFTDRDGADISIANCVSDVMGYGFQPFEDESKPLLLYWDIIESNDGSLFEHSLVTSTLERE